MGGDVQKIRAVALQAYERGRRKASLTFALALMPIPLAAIVLGTSAWLASGVALMLFVVCFFCLFVGGRLGRAITPGLIAGAIPMLLSLGARAYGHVCTADGCMTLCLPACLCGGLLAGLIVGRTGARRAPSAQERGRSNVFPNVFSSVAPAGAVALLVGSLGCSCAGYSGIIGLIAGITLTAAPLFVWRTLRPA